MTVKVESMATTYGHVPVSEDYKMEALYSAAGSVFELPPYEQVLAYLEGGPLPDLPDDLDNTPFTGYSIGKIHSRRGVTVRIITNGEREIIVEKDRVTVYFRTSTRDASAEAARGVLEHLHQHTIDTICTLELADGRYVEDADIVPDDIVVSTGSLS
jgi:hypothetical protein